MTKVIVVIGPGSIGQAIARRVGAGKCLLLADLRQENADAAAKTLSEAGFEVTATTVDVSSRDSVEALVAEASSLGGDARRGGPEGGGRPAELRGFAYRLCGGADCP